MMKHITISHEKHEQGWRVWVNGQKASAVKVQNALLLALHKAGIIPTHFSRLGRQNACKATAEVLQDYEGPGVTWAITVLLKQ